MAASQLGLESGLEQLLAAIFLSSYLITLYLSFITGHKRVITVVNHVLQGLNTGKTLTMGPY